MQAGSLVYVNARIKALENSLLSQMQLTRLMDAETLEDAFKVLVESGYGQGAGVDNPYEYEKLLKYEEKNALDFLKENAVPKYGLEAFLVEVDYHNAKAFMKAKYLKMEDTSHLVVSSGQVDLDVMKDNIFADNYDSFSKEMAKALETIDLEFVNGNRSPALIDTTLDKACYEEIFSLLQKKKNTAIYKYFTAKCDFSNIGTFVRCKNLGLDEKFFEKNFVGGGKIGKETYKELFDSPLELCYDKLAFFGYKDVIAVLSEYGLVRFETAKDDYLLGVFKSDRNDMFSVSPIAGFYLAKTVEVKVIKLVITAVKNKVDKKLVKERLRELYA